LPRIFVADVLHLEKIQAQVVVHVLQHLVAFRTRLLLWSHAELVVTVVAARKQQWLKGCTDMQLYHSPAGLFYFFGFSVSYEDVVGVERQNVPLEIFVGARAHVVREIRWTVGVEMETYGTRSIAQ
jgi:hypothetical protein